MPLIFKKLSADDYHKNYLDLVQTCDEVSYESFKKYLENLSSNTNIYVIEYNQKIIGCMSLRIESKLNEKVSYIEDLNVDEIYSHKGIKDKLIGLAIYKSHKKKCKRIMILVNDEDIECLNNKGFIEENIKCFNFKLE